MEQELLSSCGLRVVKQRTLQSLWGGYGVAMEVTARRTAGTSSSKRRHEDGEGGASVPLVVKHVKPPRGDDDDVGHLRKLRSYKVEATFYECVVPWLLQREGHPAIAEPLLVQQREDGTTLLVLSDLRVDFPVSCGSLDVDHARAALTWLAGLHAAFWSRPGLPPAGDSEGGQGGGLWEEGSFWHLNTRLDELDAVKREWPELHAAAHLIDDLLCCRGGAASYPRTLVHGDAKSANFLFSKAGGGTKAVVVAAAYDYQYAGWGDGMRDVAYLLCSSVQGGVLRRHEEVLLRHYYDTLTSSIEHADASSSSRHSYPWEVAVERFELALLDYVRWMAGWGFWGNADWAKRKARVTLDKILAQQR